MKKVNEKPCTRKKLCQLIGIMLICIMVINLMEQYHVVMETSKALKTFSCERGCEINENEIEASFQDPSLSVLMISGRPQINRRIQYSWQEFNVTEYPTEKSCLQYTTFNRRVKCIYKEVFQYILQQEVEYALLLEDDALLVDEKKLRQAYSYFKRKKLGFYSLQDNFRGCAYRFGTVANFISRDFLEKIVPLINLNDEEAIDTWLSNNFILTKTTCKIVEHYDLGKSLRGKYKKRKKRLRI